MVSAALVGGGTGPVQRTGPQAGTASSSLPWYRRAYLWGQTNITEKDPVRYDIGWWRGYWKRTRDAGRHHQRRRNRRLLSQQVSACITARSFSAAAISSAS